MYRRAARSRYGLEVHAGTGGQATVGDRVTSRTIASSPTDGGADACSVLRHLRPGSVVAAGASRQLRRDQEARWTQSKASHSPIWASEDGDKSTSGRHITCTTTKDKTPHVRRWGLHRQRLAALAHHIGKGATCRGLRDHGRRSAKPGHYARKTVNKDGWAKRGRRVRSAKMRMQSRSGKNALRSTSVAQNTRRICIVH